jgi:SAM-dependent methyltransferase
MVTSNTTEGSYSGGPIASGHWWYRGRRAAVVALARRAGAATGGRVLDYGCGRGYMGEALTRFGDVYGVEASPSIFAGGAYGAYKDVVCGDSPQALSEPPAFTLITALDVLEHVADDVGLLRVLAARLEPDGVLLVAVPLWPELFTEYDAAIGHLRRYTPATLATALAAAGLRPAAHSGYVVALLPLARRRRRRKPGAAAGHAEANLPAAPLNAALSLMALAEGSLARCFSLPPGLSYLVAARPLAAAAGAGRSVSSR